VFPNVVLVPWKAPLLSRPRTNGNLAVKGTVCNVHTDRSFAVLSLNTKAINDMLKKYFVHCQKNNHSGILKVPKVDSNNVAFLLLKHVNLVAWKTLIYSEHKQSVTHGYTVRHTAVK
jgi:hypothetical protein